MDLKTNKKPIDVRQEISNFTLIILGIFSAGMGLNGFLLSSNFIDGGVTGASMLLSKMTHVPLSIWLPIVNVPFIVVGFRSIGFAFALRSSLAITALALILHTVRFPDVTPDPLLTAVFGGLFLGAGIGLAMRGNAVLDGTEIAALLISRHHSILTVGDIILGFNTALFLAAMSVLGVEAALYSILTYVAAARTLNFVLYGLDEFTAITIVSSRSAEVCQSITSNIGRGVTVFQGQGGHSGANQEILYCVITRLEVGKIKTLTKQIDPDAFMTFQALRDVEGGVIKRRLAH